MTTNPSTSTWWETISQGQPVMVCSPMVDQSELAFRILCRRYRPNTLCFTPMLHSKRFVHDKTYRSKFFTTCEIDRPLIAQFCGDDSATLITAAKMIEKHVDAIDLNLGCPENIAKKGHYGSFLLNEPETIIQIVQEMITGLDIPVTCKIRIMESG